IFSRDWSSDVCSSDLFWLALREQRNAYFERPGMLWRLSVPSVTPPLGVGEQLIEWGGAQRWLHAADASPQFAQTVRDATVAAGEIGRASCRERLYISG